jgi:hypothetical protein
MPIILNLQRNGIYFAWQDFTSVKDAREACKVMRQQLGCKIKLSRKCKGVFSADLKGNI